jgi:hypothetical protein
MLSNDRSHVDPNNGPLASLVAQEEHVDVTSLEIIISTTMLIGTILLVTIIGRILLPMVMVMVTLMVIPPITLGARPLSLKPCSRTSSVSNCF